MRTRCLCYKHHQRSSFKNYYCLLGCLLIPDPILFLGATGVEAFPTRMAVEDRECDGRLFGTATEIFSGAAGAVGAGLFRTMIAFDGPSACVLAEVRTLPAVNPVKTRGAGTKVPVKKNNQHQKTSTSAQKLPGGAYHPLIQRHWQEPSLDSPEQNPK